MKSLGWFIKMSSFIKTNWRIKLTLLCKLILVITIIYQRQQLQKIRNMNKALKMEGFLAGKEIEDVTLKIKRLSYKNSSLLGKLTLKLGSSAILLGVDRRPRYQNGDTCHEVYLGNQFYPYQYNNWQVEKCQ